MCHQCEKLFSRYETHFSHKIFNETIQNASRICFDSNDDKLSYFMLSVAWRIMVYTMEVGNQSTFTVNEENKIKEVIEEWREWLITEQLDKIRKIQQFIIPTKDLNIFQDIKRVLGEFGFQVNDKRIIDNAGFECRTFDKDDAFKFGFTFAQVPYYIFITSMWGETEAMKQYRLGKIIKPYKGNLPKNISTILLNNHINRFLEADDKLSDNQRETIYKLALKKISR